MLSGNLPTKIDAKGRLKIPSEFRSFIESKFGTTFYISSMDGRIVRIYPYPIWEENAKVIENNSTISPALEKFATITSFYGKIVEMDSQGRVLLPPLLRKDANMNGEVIVLGMTYYLELHRMEDAREKVQKITFEREDRQELKDMGVK